MPLGERPLLVRVGVHYKFSKLLVDRVEAVDSTYDVLFIGTGSLCARDLFPVLRFLVFQPFLSFPDKNAFLSCRLRPRAEGHPPAQRTWSESGGHSGADASLSGTAKT